MGIKYGWVPPRSRKQPAKDKTFKPLSTSLFSKNPRLEEYEAMKAACPSKGMGIGNATVSAGPKYEDPALAAREAAAREVKHTVAPVCNKGAYQLITAEADLKTMGRKV